ncbi:MAG TPA: hypothetical protein PLB59_08985 [Bacteroidales bacterium]|nr:hypothetical protein [Bacteroidales bacterium]HPB26387.1 hypothetical protein [Bacteroidales bacterium]HPI30778.1 hypothetical protein [Bacteroidales bacterium]HQN16389.1 hypothetical protein [Bacteroidales bacterium]HQP16091.1 hypothetical protein [Bacteroidales bacterium]
MSDRDFQKALEQNDIDLLAQIPKSDLHNHAALGSRIEFLEKWAKQKIIRPPQEMKKFSDFEDYLEKAFNKFVKAPEFFEYAKTATLEQARLDGVKVLQISLDSRFFSGSDKDCREKIDIVQGAFRRISPGIYFVPQLGLQRNQDQKKLFYDAERLLDTGYFRSIDLYGDELYGDVESYIPLYRKAKKQGMVLTAHAGEYGTAVSVKKAVELLELDQVQHGIAASESKEVMRWLADNKIILNVCPTSNVMLCRVPSMAKHPVRILYDHGVRVTINTDDLMVFNQSVSQEYLNLYRAGVLGIGALDEIRQNGLHAFKGQ